MDYEALVGAAKQGMEEAGFVDVTACCIQGNRGRVIQVTGACPCGLGVSGGQMMLPWAAPVGPTYVRNRFNAMGRAHILVDKAAGRWK